MRRIPTYTADGARLRDYSLASIERLLEQERVTVQRAPTGVILCASFRPTDERQNPLPGRNPVAKKVHRGTYYSSLKSDGNSRVWQLHKLPTSRDFEHLYGRPRNRRESELFARAVFRSVERSVMREKTAPVIAIDDFKKASEKSLRTAA